MGVTKIKDVKEEEKPVKPAKKPEVTMMEIVRIAGTNLDGRKNVGNALLGIKGIGHMMVNFICRTSGIDSSRKLSFLSEAERERLEAVIKDPVKFGIPNWMLNRKKDRKTGEYLHLTGSDLEVARKFDVQEKIDIKSYQGVRHMFGLPVRGQRTRTSFRAGRAVGVLKKSIILATKEREKKEKK